MPSGHVEYSVSELDMRMIRAVPQGGNWKDIPLDIPSQRLAQIRESGGRTTLYGRLHWNFPSFTVTTYFNRPGNGTYIHPDFNRVITSAEAARLQSFPDSYVFSGSKSLRTKQIGNAVPPLLAFSIASAIKELNPELETVVDLFCGSGGMTLGFHWAGFRTIVANDNFKDASNTYRLNNPDTTFIFGDITELDVKSQIYDSFTKQNQVDLIIGGPPCQGFSHAGKRLIEDPRNVLYREFVKVVEECNPKIFIMENVEGILSMDKGKVFSQIKEDFENLGYVVEGRKLLAAEFGVPQKRKRVLIIGSKLRSPDEYFPQSILEKMNFLTVKDAIGDLLVDTVQDIDQQVTPLPPQTVYQKFMQGKASIQEFLKSLN